MKKKILIGLLFLVPFISILIIVLFRTVAEPTNEEIVNNVKNIKSYTADVEYIFKNSRGEEREETKQYYDREKGSRVEFGTDRTKIYKSDSILVKDNLANREYTIEPSLDKVHALAFMKNLFSYPIKEGSIKEGQEEWGDRQYLELTLEIYLDNDHLDTAKVFLDKSTQTPIGTIIFDKDGKDRVRIVYKNFEKVTQIDENLL